MSLPCLIPIGARMIQMMMVICFHCPCESILLATSSAQKFSTILHKFFALSSCVKLPLHETFIAIGLCELKSIVWVTRDWGPWPRILKAWRPIARRKLCSDSHMLVAWMSDAKPIILFESVVGFVNFWKHQNVMFLFRNLLKEISQLCLCFPSLMICHGLKVCKGCMNI